MRPSWDPRWHRDTNPSHQWPDEVAFVRRHANRHRKIGSNGSGGADLASGYQLTDDEGTFLALLVRVKSATAYQLSKIYEHSPVSNFGTSKGKIYPLIRRLKERGLIATRPVEDDARGSEVLECTAKGKRAVRTWVQEIRPNHLLLEDPLRTKVQSFDLLTHDEQLEWIARAKTALKSKLDELEEYGKEVEVPYKDQVHDNAVTSIHCRMAWLERVRRKATRKKA